MEFGLVRNGLEFSRMRRKWIVLMAALGLSSYGVYRVYQSPAMLWKRQKLIRILGALVSVAEAVSDTSETVGILSRDLKEFLQSDSDEVPKSIRQFIKIARSDVLSSVVTKFTESLIVGVVRGYHAEMGGGKEVEKSNGSSFVDQVMDRMFSKTGSGFVSIVVGSFARNLVLGYYASNDINVDSRNPSKRGEFDDPWWVNVICNDKGKEVIGKYIQTFVSTAVTVYLEKTMHINTYDEMLAGLTNPKHEVKVKDMLVSVSNGAIETLIKTSHQVLTDSESQENRGSNLFSNQSGSPKQVLNGLEVISTSLKRRKSSDEGNKNRKGWMSKASSTLSIPSNRRFVLDITGRVTFETVRSFLTVMLEKLFEALKKSINVIHDEVIDRGVEVVRYASTKTFVVATICISLCLHILNGPWLFVPSRAIEYA